MSDGHGAGARCGPPLVHTYKYVKITVFRGTFHLYLQCRKAVLGTQILKRYANIVLELFPVILNHYSPLSV
jgi:hypothetical protein